MKATPGNKRNFLSQAYRHILFIWILFSVFLLAFLFGWQSHIQHKIARDYTALLGCIYEKDESAGALAAQTILQGDATADNVALGESVLAELGYTSDGISLIKGNLFSNDAFFPLAVLGAIVLCCLFGILLAQTLYHTRLAEHESTLKQVQAETASQLSYMENRIKQMRQFMENVAHQVKIPLAGLLVTLELADDSCKCTADIELHNLIEDGKKQITRVDHLMNRLLKIGRMEAGQILFEKTPDNLRDLLQSLPLSPEQKAHIHYDLESVEMPFDRDWMSEAICCMAEDCLEVSDEVQIQLTADPETIQLTISGNKAPFSAEEADRLFDRFYIPEQSKKSGHYGIGLHFAALVISGHNGNIHAFSDENGGGFRVSFPRLELKAGKL